MKKLINQTNMNNTLTGSKVQPANLHYEAAEAFFKPCPFCGNSVNVFLVSETRYGDQSPYGWTLECKNMGCIFQRPSADQSLKHLAESWNERV